MDPGAVLPQVPEPDREAATEALAMLSKAPKGWLSTRDLEKAVGVKEAGRVVRKLKRLQAIVALGKFKNRTVYALSDGKTAKQLAALKIREELASLRTPLKMQALPLAPDNDLYAKVWPTGMRNQLKSVVAQLVKEREVVPLKIAGRNYFQFVETMREIIQSSPGQSATTDGDASPPQPAPDSPTTPVDPRAKIPPASTLDIHAVKAAYRRLVDRTRVPNVGIYDLHRESGASLDPLKEWLTEECFAHRAVPSRGEPTAATPEELAAGLHIRDNVFLYIRLDEADT